MRGGTDGGRGRRSPAAGRAGARARCAARARLVHPNVGPVVAARILPDESTVVDEGRDVEISAAHAAGQSRRRVASVVGTARGGAREIGSQRDGAVAMVAPHNAVRIAEAYWLVFSLFCIVPRSMGCVMTVR